MCFNTVCIGIFFTNLETLLMKHEFGLAQIYNLNASGISTVQAPNKVIASTGIKQVGQITSAERGVLVTMCACINAIGNTIPPIFIFPRVHFQEHLLNGAPLGSVGAADKSRWMNSEICVSYLRHFIKHTNCSKNNNVLLVTGNHDTDVQLEVVDLARGTGIVILTLPSHCSHKLQPLDRVVFGAFKRFYNSACNEWMMDHPGKPITIYNIAAIAGVAIPKRSCQ